MPPAEKVMMDLRGFCFTKNELLLSYSEIDNEQSVDRLSIAVDIDIDIVYRLSIGVLFVF